MYGFMQEAKNQMTEMFDFMDLFLCFITKDNNCVYPVQMNNVRTFEPR